MAAGAPVPFSTVGYSTREEVLSSDLNRMGKLGSRELQDLQADASRTDESLGGGDPHTGRGSRVNTASLLPTLGFNSAFLMNLGPGQLFLQDNTIATDITNNGDDSQYQVVRWPAQIIGFTSPDPGNPRIDLLVATPSVTPADVTSRNTLVNPITRALSPLSVPKTNNPGVNLQIVAGTPDPQPVAPSVPLGAVAVFEVYVPAAAADASTFVAVRRIHRRGSISVGAAMHGILRGCHLTWDVQDEASVVSPLLVGNASTAEPSRVVIDGEVLTFTRLSSLGPTNLPGIVADAGANSPYAAAAPATSDKVYYLYLCGGKNLPQARRTTLSGAGLQPLVVVESLVAPNRNGRPSSAITTPRGTTQEGALYIGVGYVVMNSTRRKGCYTDGDWIYAMTGQNFGAFKWAGFNDSASRLGALSGGAATSHQLGDATVRGFPNLATQCLLDIAVDTTGGTFAYFDAGQSVGSGTTAEGFVYIPSNATAVFQKFEFRMQPSASGFVRISPVTGLVSMTSFYMWARGWNMNVPRYGAL
jgi:hypothetical protein